MTPSVLSLTKTSTRSQHGEDHSPAPLDYPVVVDERQQMLAKCRVRRKLRQDLEDSPVCRLLCHGTARMAHSGNVDRVWDWPVSLC